MKEVKSTLGDEAEVFSGSVDSLDKYDYPATLRFNFTLHRDGEPDLIYFNPVLAQRYTSNPFRSTVRKYPVEMPFCTDETYLLTMDIPEGYTTEEIPKSAKILLNQTDGYFEYLIQKSSTQIQMRARLKTEKSQLPNRRLQYTARFLRVYRQKRK